MRFAQVNGVAIHYSVIGSADEKPVIVFSNSIGTDFRIWDGVVERLAGDFAIVLYDKRGHGLSDLGTPPYTIADHVADLAGLLDHLAVRRAVVCGLSVGGLIAQGLCAERPDLVEVMILCDTAVRIGGDEMWNQRIEAVTRSGLASIAEMVLERWFTERMRGGGGPELAGYRNMLVRTPAEGYVGTCVAIRDADFTAQARAIAKPVLCIVGDKDAATPPSLVAETAALIPDAGYLVIAEAGHLPCIEQPELTAAAIRTFIAQQSEQGAD